MTTFDTPEPIHADVHLMVGTVRITASDRVDTVVEVRPRRDGNQSDIQAAENTTVRYSGGRLSVTAPKPTLPGGLRGILGFLGGGGSVEIDIALPTGSHVRGHGSATSFTGTGRLGECQMKTTAGNVDLDEVGPLVLNTVTGDVTVDRADGRCEVTNGSGSLRLGELNGPATVKNSNGDTYIAAGNDGLRVRAANGSITVDRARGTVTAKSANGRIRIGEMSGGALDLDTANGDLEIGIADGLAAWLDVNTFSGSVRNQMEPSEHPDPDADTVEVRARTAHGDITIRRS
ncbi:DUF4097 family beta strand repeat-containing protein [Speluncibacter jeojiensis]|uniref:DUF4097 domain-containing protein n=1 Tax=Speluncibacter jeojiensis TaxID=2710754 RepID=A0A9X4RD54_9ACTN|nr:DUF4097 domain-containing protein [Corynebacteriales bacterium D3-21]